MHLNPYGEYAVLLAASLANDWPEDRDGIAARARELGMTMTFPVGHDDHAGTRRVIDDWLAILDATEPTERARLLSRFAELSAAYHALAG
jgi:hypothetical protein